MNIPRIILLATLLAACGGGNSGTNSPPVDPVATVRITGAERVKVGDPYQYSVEARTSDGDIVQRAVTWTVQPGHGSISGNGTFVASATGATAIQATVGGISTSTNVNAYDWVPLASGTVIGVGIDADDLITNKFGSSEFAVLLIGCSNGTFVVGVATSGFVTANGMVAYSFDGGAVVTSNWMETSSFNSLGYPGTSNLARKSFATQMASHSRFSFAFGEFRGSTHSMDFRLSGLTPYLAPVFAACPSNALRTSGTAPTAPVDALRELLDLAATQT